MARIRTIKPEFWDSPGSETVDPRWRLLYIAMWNWADDYGRGKAEARELLGFAFPRDEQLTLDEFRGGLGEVRRVFHVKFYKIDGRSFYWVSTWEKHQRIDKRSGARWPEYDPATEYDPVDGSLVNTGVKSVPDILRRGPVEDPSRVPATPGVGTEEQGNRGTVLSSSPRRGDREIQSLFDEFWSVFPRKVAKAAAQRRFTTLVKRGSDPLEIIEGAKRYAEERRGQDAQYTKQPDGWLNAGRWQDEPSGVQQGRPSLAPNQTAGWMAS
jgi:hypothetical protein